VPNDQHDVFLSYSSEDAAVANRLRDELAARGYDVWLDKIALLPGDDLSEIFSAIERSKYFIILLTRSSVRSAFVGQELSAARIREIEQGHIIVIPLLYESCPIPPALRSKIYLDFRSFPEGLQELDRSLVRHEQRLRGSLETAAEPSAGPKLGDMADRLASKFRDASELYLAVDLGGTKAYVSIMTPDAERLFDRKYATTGHRDPAGLQKFLVSSIRDTLDSAHEATGESVAKVTERIKAFGIAFAGPTDSARGVVRDASNFAIKDYPLAERLSLVFEKPVFVGNDADLGAIGEAWKGVGRRCRNVIGIVIGTGIGGGIIIDGQLYGGMSNAAGEIGHMVVDVNSPELCGCGQRGCFEAVASRRAIARQLHRRKQEKNDHDMRWDENNLGSNELAYYVDIGDTDALELVGKASEIWGKAVFSLLNVLNPELVFFGGGFVRQLGDSFLEPVRAEAQKCMNPIYESNGKTVPIKVAELENPMLMGACLLAMRGSRRRSTRGSILAAATSRIGERDFRILRSLCGFSAPTLIAGDPGNDFHKESLRRLRDSGLIATTDGQSLGNATFVQATELGRIVIEEAPGSAGSENGPAD
jgi:glucokinase